MITCHNINIIVKTTGRYASSLNDKSESPNKTLTNIKIAILMNSSHNKDLYLFYFHYFIWISCRTENWLCVNVPYLLWNGTRPSYKQLKIWGVRFYTINGSVKRKKLYDVTHWGYFMEYAATKEVIIYWNPYQPFISIYPIMIGLMNIITLYPYKTSTIQIIYSFNNILKFLFIIQTI